VEAALISPHPIKEDQKRKQGGNALRDQDVENRLPQIQREIESSLQVGV